MTSAQSRRVETVHVLGAGLIGTSIGLAARSAGLAVTLYDRDEGRLARAVALGAGDAAAVLQAADVAVAAVPPRAIREVVVQQLRADLARTVTHVCSVQAQPLLDIESAVGQSARFVGGHPIAGREQSGPGAATADLFRDRAWVLCPTSGTSAGAVADVEQLAAACGARPFRMTAAEHDELLARLSHVPQVVASSLAASVAHLPAELVALAGSGLRDTTRLADSDVQLWTEIISANPAAVAQALGDITARLTALGVALDRGGADMIAANVADLLAQGREGRSKLPGKHGRQPTAWATVSVVVPDRPGALAELLAAVAQHDVNLEDLRVEHAPGQPQGSAELAVDPAAQVQLVASLRAAGWSVSLGADAAR